MQQLADSYFDLGCIEEAMSMLQSVVEGHKSWLGEHNPETLISMIKLGRCYFVQRRQEEAVQLAEAVVAQMDMLWEGLPLTMWASQQLRNFRILGEVQSTIL